MDTISTEGRRESSLIDAQLWEIAENLHRADLSALERSEQIAEWVRLTEEKQKFHSSQVETNESKRADGKGHRHESGLRAASRELGIDKSKAHRAVQIASIDEEAKEEAIKAGIADNQSALLRVARVHLFTCAKERRDDESIELR